MQISPLSDQLGVALSELDISDKLDDEQLNKIVSLLYEHAVVCIREQSVTPRQLSDFASRLGRPVQHNEENLRLDGLPGVMSLSNADDRDDRQLNGGAHWHTDLVYTEEPASFTMLHAVAVPASGGGTLFADQVAAWKALSAAEQERLRNLVVVHCYEGRTDGSYPNVTQPLVRAHPAAAKEALYGAADTGVGIVGMDAEAARELYLEIGEHATRPEFVYRHQYHLNDVVIWDNAQLLHSAEVLERARAENENRIMHRVSVRGWPETS